MGGLRSSGEVTLISFIGKARKEGEGRRYQKTPYRFEDGRVYEATFFGSALAKYLGQALKRAVFVGTKGSTWSELVELLPEEAQEDLLEFMERIDSLGENVSEENLKEFQHVLEEKLSYGVDLICVSSSPDNAYEIKEKLFSVLDPVPENIAFDITHAYRYMPFVALLTVIPLKHLGTKSITIYYGFLEMKEKEKPVLRLDILSELINLNEALSVFHNTGNFAELGSTLFPEHAELFRDANFKIEINQRPRKEIDQILGLDLSGVYARSLKEEIERLSSEKYLEDRLVRRAEFFIERKQYLKAIILLSEAVLIKLYSLSGKTHKTGYKSWEEIDLNSLVPEQEDRDIINIFRVLRNTVVHSSEPTRKHAGEVKSLISNEDKLRSFLIEVISVYNKLKR